MTTATPNEAWTRQPAGEDQLRRRMREWKYGQQWLDALDVALAAERRATVERIRESGWIEGVPLAACRVNAERLQRAMREAHGRRISLTETYAEAIARNYNRILDDEAKR